MYQEALNTLMAAAVSALIGVLVVAIKAFGDVAVQFVKTKIEAAQAKMGAEEYNKKKAFALDAWRIVDEYFRITPTVTKTVEAAQAKFAEELKKLVPSVTDDEIDTLRQAIAGEINKGKDAIVGEVQ